MEQSVIHRHSTTLQMICRRRIAATQTGVDRNFRSPIHSKESPLLKLIGLLWEEIFKIFLSKVKSIDKIEINEKLDTVGPVTSVAHCYLQVKDGNWRNATDLVPAIEEA
ncbi:hypothetical protein LOAG_04993 [Loa loa]|uniref:Uncharacterized protein n=1 Tax=Loa loa TaxID=7209 RepID=A0A1S0U179_LOALO|nr:hypothetical protein LOAG_04993 [Loa loa]EFO23497.1 hypothetical protein LOAG_04993 [Loa loa]